MKYLYYFQPAKGNPLRKGFNFQENTLYLATGDMTDILRLAAPDERINWLVQGNRKAFGIEPRFFAVVQDGDYKRLKNIMETIFKNQDLVIDPIPEGWGFRYKQ